MGHHVLSIDNVLCHRGITDDSAEITMSDGRDDIPALADTDWPEVTAYIAFNDAINVFSFPGQNIYPFIFLIFSENSSINSKG